MNFHALADSHPSRLSFYLIMLKFGFTLIIISSRRRRRTRKNNLYGQQWTKVIDNKSQKQIMLRRVGCWLCLFRNVNFTVIKQWTRNDKERMQQETLNGSIRLHESSWKSQHNAKRRKRKENWNHKRKDLLLADTLTETDLSQVVR